MKRVLPDEESVKLKKANRARRLSPKIHKVIHESGRSSKGLWRKIVERSASLRKKVNHV